MSDPKCARGGGVSHILAEKEGVSFTLIKKCTIFTNKGGVRPMLDLPLVVPVLKHLQQIGLGNLKGLNQAKIKKNVILFLLLNMTI